MAKGLRDAVEEAVKQHPPCFHVSTDAGFANTVGLTVAPAVARWLLDSTNYDPLQVEIPLPEPLRVMLVALVDEED